MAQKTSSALEDLRFLEKRFTGILALIPQFENINSLENRIAELEKVFDKTQIAVNDKMVYLSKLGQEVADVQAVADKNLQQTKTEAVNITETARQDAHLIVQKAYSEAKKLLDTAKGEVEGMTQLIEMKQAEYKLLVIEVDKMVDKLSQLNAQLAALKSKL